MSDLQLNFETGRILGCVLAAGEGRRFGGAKQLALVAGRPLLTWAVRAALEAGLWRVLVVTGHYAEKVAAILPGVTALEIITNTAPRQGLGSSLALATRRAGELEAQGLVVLLGDMPLVQPRTIKKVAKQALINPAGLAAARVAGHWGHPVAFTRQHFDELTRLDGDQGAKKLVQRLAGDMHLVEAQEWSNLDVDDARQLARVQTFLERLQAESQ